MSKKENTLLGCCLYKGFADRTRTYANSLTTPCPKLYPPPVASNYTIQPTRPIPQQCLATILQSCLCNQGWCHAKTPLSLTSTRACRQEGGNEASSISGRPHCLDKMHQPVCQTCTWAHLSPPKSFLPMLKLPDKLLYLCLLTKHSTCTTPDKKMFCPCKAVHFKYFVPQGGLRGYFTFRSLQGKWKDNLRETTK